MCHKMARGEGAGLCTPWQVRTNPYQMLLHPMDSHRTFQNVIRHLSNIVNTLMTVASTVLSRSL